MAQATSNLLSLNPTAPKTSFGQFPSLGTIAGNIGGAINNTLGAIGNVKFGQPPTTQSFSTNPTLQPSANQAQTTSASSPISVPQGTSPSTSASQTYNSYNTAGGIGSKDYQLAPQQTQSQPQTFPGLLNLLQGASQPNSTQTGLVNQLRDASQNNTALGDKANTIANNYGQQIAGVNKYFTGLGTGDQSTGTSPVGEGNAQLAYNAGSQRISGLSQAEQAALNGIGYQLTGQSQLQSGLTSALGGANTQQGQQISGLGTASNLAQPQLSNIGTQQYYNPLTGSGVGGSQYGNGPAAGANVQSIQDQTKLVNDLSAARSSAQNISGQLSSFLQQNQINPSDFNAVNQFIQRISGQTSSPQYQTFRNLATDLASVYAQILTPPGSTVSDFSKQLAQGLIDATAKGQSLSTVISDLDQQAFNKIQGIQSNISTLNSGGNVNTAPTSSTSSGGNTFGWNG